MVIFSEESITGNTITSLKSIPPPPRYQFIHVPLGAKHSENKVSCPRSQRTPTAVSLMCYLEEQSRTFLCHERPVVETLLHLRNRLKELVLFYPRCVGKTSRVL